MPGGNAIHIQKLIVHKVDHRNFDEPQLSDLTTPLSESVRSFLRRHINTSRGHKNTRSAVFLPEEELPKEDTPTQAICDTILEDSSDEVFVSQSRILAQRLFDQLTGATSPGDLTVCTFEEQGGELWLALLKMDPSEGFTSKRVEVHGKYRVILEPTGEILPSSETELQKCAFILPRTPREDYHLKVLDQQNRRYGVRQAIATFFSEGFLQSKVLPNRADKTQSFISGSLKWLSSRRMEWPDYDVRHFGQRLHATLRDQTVDIEAFANEVISDHDEQMEYFDHMREIGMEDFVFQPDPQKRERILQYRTFEGDNGLRVRINADAIGENKTLQYHPDPDDENITVVCIRTVRWDET